MPFLDYKGDGKKYEYVGSVYTLEVYERQFGGDLIQDVFGKILRSEDKDIATFFSSSYTAELRAFWAMLRTADYINEMHGKKHGDTPDYREWMISLDSSVVDMNAIDSAVVSECLKKFFPAYKRLSEEAEEAEQASA